MGFNLITSKVFVIYVHQLNTMFASIQFSFFMKPRISPGKIVFGVVPSKNYNKCPSKRFIFIIHVLIPSKTIIGVTGKVVHLHYTTVYFVCLSVALVAFRSG